MGFVHIFNMGFLKFMEYGILGIVLHLVGFILIIIGFLSLGGIPLGGFEAFSGAKLPSLDTTSASVFFILGVLSVISGFYFRSRAKRSVGHKVDITKDSKPLTILKDRYARGEITKKQYEEMKKELKK